MEGGIRNQINFDLVKWSGCRDYDNKQTRMRTWVAHCLRHAYPFESDDDTYDAYLPLQMEYEISFAANRRINFDSIVTQWCVILSDDEVSLPAPVNDRTRVRT